MHAAPSDVVRGRSCLFLYVSLSLENAWLVRVGKMILPTCFGLKEFPFLKNDFKYQQTVLDMLKTDKQLSAENLLVVKQKMKWAVEPIRQDKSLSKADIRTDFQVLAKFA